MDVTITVQCDIVVMVSSDTQCTVIAHSNSSIFIRYNCQDSQILECSGP